MRYVFTKIGMTSAFDEQGREQAVTLLQLRPGTVMRHETLADGRTVVVVRYSLAHGKKDRFIERGWVVKNSTDFPVGSPLVAPGFNVGQLVDITGKSKGRGFQDAMTRHGFHGGPASHGSRFHRAPGSIGMRTEPGRVMKGKKMPGQFGNVRVTVRKLKVAYWSADGLVLAIAGGVPGARNSVLFV